MADTARRETPDVVTGNVTDKCRAGNPAIRLLTSRFLARLDAVLDGIEAECPEAAVLEVGCGEGEISARLHARWGDVTAVDLPDAGLRAEWARRPGPRYVHADAHRLPLPDGCVDVAVAVEVLEHLPDPARGLAELARVSRRHLVLSVPREPLFRLGNLVTGRHVRALGNTPGHINHWRTVDFVRFVSQAAAVRDVRTPLPWTLLWARVH